MKRLLTILFVFVSAYMFGQSSMGNLNMPTSSATFPLAIAPYAYEVTQVDSNITVVITGSYTTSDNLRDVYSDGNYYVLSGGGGASNWDKSNDTITPIAGVDVVDIRGDTLSADGSLWFTDPHNATNVMIGDGAGATSATHGNDNIGIGKDALKAVQSGGSKNTVAGSGAGIKITSGDDHTLYGYQAGEELTTNTTGITAIGSQALSHNTSDGIFNTAIGKGALFTVTSGDKNTAVGYSSGLQFNTGEHNSSLGSFSGYGWAGASSRNTAIGSYSMFTNTSSGSNDNVGVGYYTLYDLNGTDSENTAVGSKAGENNSGSGNLFLGFSAGQNEIGSNKLYIENSNSATPLIHGDFAADSVTINGTLSSNNTIVEMYDPATVISTADVASWYTLKGWTKGDTLNGRADVGDSMAIVNQYGWYHVNFNMSFQHATINTTVDAELHKRDGAGSWTGNSDLHLERKIGTGGQIGSAFFQGMIILNAGDTVAVRAQGDNAGNLTINHGNLTIIRIR